LLRKQAKAKVFFIYFCALLIKAGVCNFFDDIFLGMLVSGMLVSST
jgi:murein L,D-transpeptidase YcbB/YkuD